VVLVPTATWPNETVEGLAVTLSLVAPVPWSCTKRVEFEALLVKRIHAPVHPVLVGEKVTFSVALCPAGRVNGKLKPEALNSVAIRFIAETVTLVCPLLVKTRTSVSGCPTITLPKFKADGAPVSCVAPALKGIITADTVAVMMKMKKKARIEKRRAGDRGSRIPLV
jgi:hypothetical protein